jgi:bisphosphoglycerate-dependent phosphoglycerate mutase
MGTRGEVDEIDDQLTNNLMNASVKKANPMAFSGSQLSTDEEMKIKSAIKSTNKRNGNMRIVGKLPKEVFDMFQYDIQFYSGSTAFDKRERMQMYNELIMEARSNPNSRYSSDKIMEAKLDLYDINPKRFEKSAEEVQREQAMMQQAQMAQQQQMSKLPNTSVV